MKLLYLEFLAVLIYGVLARNIECDTLNIKGQCSSLCPCPDGAECADGFCLSNVNLLKRSSCSSLRAKGRCSSDCPCAKSGECCSKYGYCGTSSFYCGTSSSSHKKSTTKKRTTSTKKTTTKKSTTKAKTATKSRNYGSEVSVNTTSSPGVIIYLPSYRLDSEIDINKFDFSKINVFNYGFYEFTNDGEPYPNNYDMDIKYNMMNIVNTDLKKKYPHLKVILVIGGTQGSKNFKYFMKESSTRDTAAKGIVKVVQEYDFDGLDIDWEFPKTEEEANNLLSFIKKVREYMGYEKLLTLSSSALTYRYYGNVGEMEPYLNWFNLMTYHYSGYWDKFTGLNAPIYGLDEDKNKQYNSDYTVDSYHEEGVPYKKIILGAPFMGQAWKVESSENDGYNQRGDANIKGEPCNANREGFWSYRSLREEGILVDKKETSSGWKRTWHSDGRCPTIFNKSTSIYISYDDVDSMCERSRYVKNKGIGGIMVWETGQDYNRELLDSILDCY